MITYSHSTPKLPRRITGRKSTNEPINATLLLPPSQDIRHAAPLSMEISKPDKTSKNSILEEEEEEQRRKQAHPWVVVVVGFGRARLSTLKARTSTARSHHTLVTNLKIRFIRDTRKKRGSKGSSGPRKGSINMAGTSKAHMPSTNGGPCPPSKRRRRGRRTRGRLRRRGTTSRNLRKRGSRLEAKVSMKAMIGEGTRATRRRKSRL